MVDATTVYNYIESVLDGCLTDMDVSYTRSVDSAGNQDTHMFIIIGRTEDRKFVHGLHEVLETYESARFDLDHTSNGVYIALEFVDEDITNAPPEPQKSYKTVFPRDAKRETISECSNCRCATPDAYPPLVLRYDDGSFKDPVDEYHSLCVKCTPGNFDDVVRRVKAFGIEDGHVAGVLFEERTVYNNDTGAQEVIGPEWVPGEDLDNPYVDDVIQLIERDLLESD